MDVSSSLIQTARRPKFDLWALVQNIVILALWLWLYTPTYALLRVVALREDFRTNQVILVGIVILLALRLRQEHVQIRLDQPMHRHGPALLLMLGSSIAYLVSEHFFDINILAACLFGLGSYGLLGLWLSPQRWHEGLPVALLLIGVLPFGDHIQTFIGYPMRIFTAELVRHGLNGTGIASLGTDTILVFENSVAHIDVPCSGVKSLWTGGLFLLAATWIDRKPINLRWVLIACVFGLVLFVANLTRVALLILTGPVLGWTFLAELIHVPLGVLMFIVACGVAVGLLRQLPQIPSLKGEAVMTQKPIADLPGKTGNVSFRRAARRNLYVGSLRKCDVKIPPLRQAQGRNDIFPAKVGRAPIAYSTSRLRSYAVQTLLVGVLLAMNLGYSARPRLEASLSAEILPSAFLQLPRALNTSPMQLRPGELEWLAQDGAEAIERVRFRWRGLAGSLLIVQSPSWRAHHKPERCFENYGLQTQASATQLLDATLPVRALRLGTPKTGDSLSAIYWFQSAQPTAQSTDDYSVRLWSAVSLQPPRWMLVTILFDQPYMDQADPLRVAASACASALKRPRSYTKPFGLRLSPKGFALGSRDFSRQQRRK